MTRARTRQERLYETWYRDTGDDFGFPDPKISEAILTSPARILSLGGGQGNDLWHLAGHNTIVLADYATSGLEIAGKRGLRPLRLDLNDAVALPFADNTFDVVVCKDILEHILEPLRVLKEVRRVLRPSGRLVVNVPNHFYLPMRLRILLGKGLIWKTLVADHQEAYDEWDYMHIRFFTFKGFKRLLVRSGFVHERFYWDFGPLAHYGNPDMWFAPQTWKRSLGRRLSPRGRFALYVLLPLWRAFNIVLPRRIRAMVVSLAPGLLSASFYVRCRISSDQ